MNINAKQIAEIEECLAGMMICGALNGMYLSPEMEAWCTKVLGGKKRTPAQIWLELFGDSVPKTKGLTRK